MYFIGAEINNIISDEGIKIKNKEGKLIKEIPESNRLEYEINLVKELKEKDTDLRLSYLCYIGTIEYSEEDKCFYGKVLKKHGKLINDLILYEGKTIDELNENFKENIDNYIELRESIN